MFKFGAFAFILSGVFPCNFFDLGLKSNSRGYSINSCGGLTWWKVELMVPVMLLLFLCSCCCWLFCFVACGWHVMEEVGSRWIRDLEEPAQELVRR